MATAPISLAPSVEFIQGQATAGLATWTFHAVNSADSTDATGKTFVLTISKAGAAFASPNGGTAVTELANGGYKVVHNAADFDTLGVLAARLTSAGVDTVNAVHQVIALNTAVATVDPSSAGVTSIQSGLATHADVTAISVPSATKTFAMGTIAADGPSSGVSCNKALAVTLTATGTFGGGTVQVQTCADPTAASPVWVNVSGATLTSNGSKAVTLPAGAVRWNMSGSTSPSVVCTATITYPA